VQDSSGSSRLSMVNVTDGSHVYVRLSALKLFCSHTFNKSKLIKFFAYLKVFVPLLRLEKGVENENALLLKASQ
jgi:hypothetical protein